MITTYGVQQGYAQGINENYTWTFTCLSRQGTKEIGFLIVKLGSSAPVHRYVYTWLVSPLLSVCVYPHCISLKHLRELALPLQAQGLVDPELAGNRESGSYNSDTAYASDHLAWSILQRVMDLPEHHNCAMG